MATFQSVQYIDPFAPLPIGYTQAGVSATLLGPPSGTVAYALLQGNQTPIGYGTGATGTAVRVLNTVPLAGGVAYQLLVQFQQAGKNPADLDWSGAGILTAPVVVQLGRIVSVQVTGTGLTATWETPATSSVAGGYLELIDLTNNSTAGKYYLGSAQNASLTATFTAGLSYGVRISAVQPVNGASTGGFTGPYTIGPPTVPLPIPTGAPALTQLSCTAAGVAAQWTAPAVPANAGPARYELLLLDGGKLIASAVAGSTGGQLTSGELASLGTPQLAARMSYGSFVGPIPTGAALYRYSPQISSISVSYDSSPTITAQLSYPAGLPPGGVLVATLYNAGNPGPTQTLATSSGSVSWSNLPVVDGYSIGVALQVTSGGVQSLGAPSVRVAVPMHAPSGMQASYDGQQLSIGLAFPVSQPVDGYQVTLTGSGGGSQQLQAGPQLPITFTTNLDLSQTWKASVMPLVGIVSALPNTTVVSLPTVTKPTLTSVGYDGAELSLQWTAAALPYITGYQVAVSGGPSLVVGSEQTSCVLPLTPSQASSAEVTVTGLSAMRNTSASVAVPVLTSSIQVSSVTVGSQVVASWTASPAPPAVRAVLMLGDSVVSELAGATTTGVSFAAPTPAGQPYTLLAYPVSTDGVATGPACAPVPLILTAPSIESGQLDGAGRLSLRWAPGNSFGVTGYQLTATPTTGAPTSLTVTGTGYDGPAPAAFGQPGTLTVTPTGGRCTGPAAQVTVSAAPTVSSASYASGQLTVSADLSAAGATDTSWLDVLVNGAVVARQLITGQGQSPFTVPAVLPADSAAAVQLSTVGPGALAPASAPLTVPTRVPEVLDAAYDGSQLHVRWTPTDEPGVTGYWVSVAGTALPDTYVAGAASDSVALTVSLSYPFPAGVSVSVRAGAGTSGGPHGVGQQSAGLAPSLAGNCYAAATSDASYPPYLYRRGVYQTLAAVTGKAITLYLANPFTGTDNPTVPASGSPVFQLAPAPEGSSLPYQLTMSTDVWTTLGADPVRTTLRDTYNQFLTDVETAGVQPWAIGLIRQLIAQAMPQTFEEVLFYRYGYWHSDSLRVVDLTPGTRLQLSNALYQTVVGGTSEKNGFLAVGNELMDVVEAIPQFGASTSQPGAARILSVDALLSLVYPGSGSAPTGSPVAAGPIDFSSDGNRQSYYRLFFPASFPPSGSNGSTSLTSNITLVGTTSWATLTSVTTQYAATGSFPTGLSYFTVYFRGRSALTPLVNLSVQGESRWVSIGTTARQALTSIGLAPYAGSGGDLLSLLRASANLYGYPTPDGALAMDPVDLTGADLGNVTPVYWPLDMPLVGGDQLSVRQLPAFGQ